MSIPTSDVHQIAKVVSQQCGCRSKGAWMWYDGPALRGIIHVQRTAWGDGTLYVNVAFSITPPTPGKAPLQRDCEMSVRAERIPGNPHCELIRSMKLLTERPASAAEVHQVLAWSCQWMMKTANDPIGLARLVADESSWWRDAAGASGIAREWARKTMDMAAST